ncbi:substrate-binding periplasmic protein [Roseateles koreensis]|uniref:Transporter substrate-binding domain-containing protein n=1 Tax=Roseateles koreensis TaxID=2987526 RepID=A0ABT5KTC3_9BURK|nr:transporter substrate-binding domain-containing protein [Roseateles koreensis]MDC8786193.1 transporter substrate-binding domain-containing protein [Roseateles koreensis]
MRLQAVFSLLLFGCTPFALAEKLTACADRAETPPFTFAKRVNGQATGSLTGISVDLLKSIATSKGLDLQVQLLPWARCLREVMEDRIQVAINVGREEAESNGLWLSKPYFSTHAVVLYSRKTHPEGLTMDSMADIHKLHVCGLGGYRFEAFGLATKDVDRGVTRSYEQLITKLHLGRCDLVIDSRETVAGMYLVDPKLRTLLVDGNLAMKPLPGALARDLNLAVSAKGPGSLALLRMLDEGIDRFGKRQDMERLINAYLDP